MHEPSGGGTEHQHAADLRVASDTFLQRVDRLLELETHKRELAPNSPEFVRIAREVEDLSRALLVTSGQQLELAEEVAADAKRGRGAPDLPIQDTPPRRTAVAILQEWRAAERRLAASAPGSREEAESRADVDRLRREYGRAMEGTGDRG